MTECCCLSTFLTLCHGPVPFQELQVTASPMTGTRENFTTNRIFHQEILFLLREGLFNMSDRTNQLGNIYVSPRAIATIASQSTIESYGVVGLAAKNLAEGLAQVLVKDPSLGVEVKFDEDSLQIDLYIIVEYGVRIKSVANSVQDNVRYSVEKAIGTPVNRVDVHVRGLRISNTD
jgi:uncharacterized alkaline shock family protein YloU